MNNKTTKTYLFKDCKIKRNNFCIEHMSNGYNKSLIYFKSSHTFSLIEKTAINTTKSPLLTTYTKFCESGRI